MQNPVNKIAFLGSPAHSTKAAWDKPPWSIPGVANSTHVSKLFKDAIEEKVETELKIWDLNLNNEHQLKYLKALFLKLSEPQEANKLYSSVAKCDIPCPKNIGIFHPYLSQTSSNINANSWARVRANTGSNI